MWCSIAAGLSVDFVIHMAESYAKCGLFATDSDGADRKTRAEAALSHMGGTVLHSAATTTLACSILVFSRSKILYQVGTIICFNIVSGCIVALVFFPAMLALFGPEQMAPQRTRSSSMVRVLISMGFVCTTVVTYKLLQ